MAVDLARSQVGVHVGTGQALAGSTPQLIFTAGGGAKAATAGSNARIIMASGRGGLASGHWTGEPYHEHPSNAVPSFTRESPTTQGVECAGSPRAGGRGGVG